TTRLFIPSYCPKVRLLLEKNQSDVKVICLILGFYEKILPRLERGNILEQVIPTLLAMRLSDPDIINRVVSTGLGQWFFGSNNSANTDSNFLRVVSSFPGRRLSDNTLMTPKIRIAQSCSSSPGGTPGGTSGLCPRVDTPASDHKSAEVQL
ncbi:unnamed protein product, partial [Arctia plantaginis]